MAELSERKTITVALAGQPNVGKSTVFNLLTGLNQHVGNWPGKTVEQKTGTFHYEGLTMSIVDLPGTYSLSANSAEEMVARDFIIKEKPDAVVAILNAASLERTLYLVAELLPLPSPVIVGLNMMDVAEEAGLHIEPQVLQSALGVPVVPLVASDNRGVRELVEQITKMVKGETCYQPKVPRIRKDHQEISAQIEGLIDGYVPEPYPRHWVALKLLEGDSEITEMMHRRAPKENWDRVQQILHQHEDAVIAVASGRYAWIGRMIRAALTRPKAGQITFTQRMDEVATHPVWGMILLTAILALIFWLTYTVGAPLQNLIDVHIVQGLARWAEEITSAAPDWVTGLLVDGIIGGVGTVLTFFPILAIFFATMGLLEDMGYMARAAYVMDRFMHVMGLHGKSFLPLFLGFGCNVPAVMGARIIDSQKARLLTIMLAPLVPCTARMAVVAVLAPAFFGSAAPFVSWGLVALNLVVLALLGVAINHLAFKGRRAAFIMELPLYHIPNLRTIGITVWQRLAAFLRKATTVILVVSVIVWTLSVLPAGDIESSYLARLGRLLAPAGSLMGLGWRAMVSLLTSFVAKEKAIATLGVLYGSGQEDVQLTQILRSVMTPAAGLAFLVVTMLFIPCVATVAAIRQETASWKWTTLNMILILVVSLSGGIAAYQLGTWLGMGG